MASSNVVQVVMLLAVCVSAAANPGFVARITQKGMEFACKVGMSVLEEDLATVSLQDFSEYIVPFNYNFYGMTTKNFQLPNSKVNVVPNVGLNLSISGGSTEINGKWNISTESDSLVSPDGKFVAQVEGVSITVGMELGSDGTGRPTMTTTDCSCHVSKVHTCISDHITCIISARNCQVDKKLKKAIESQLCPLVHNTISTKLEPILQAHQVTRKIDRVAALDYSLSGLPLMTAEHMDIPLEGKFFEMAHPAPPPFSASPMSLPADHIHMVYFGVSGYMLNTATYVYQSAGYLTLNFTDDMIPEYFETRLKTESFGELIPRISQMYPKMLMEMKISSASTPLVEIKEGDVTISDKIDIEAFAIFPNDTRAPLFALNVTGSAQVTATVVSGRMVGKMAHSRLKIDLRNSYVGAFSVQILKPFVDSFFSDIMLPLLNDILSFGYPLPILAHLQLNNLDIEPHEDALVFGADVHF